MASIRKITYSLKNGKPSVYWQVSYYVGGKRKKKQFDRQSKANAFKIKVEGELHAGIHIADKESVTISEAALKFLDDFEALVHSGLRERSTFKQYYFHVYNHINTSSIADGLVKDLKASDCRKFANELLAKTTDTQAGKIMTTFRMVVDFAVGHDWANSNPAKSVKVRKRTRRVKSLKIPSKDIIKSILESASTAKERAFVYIGFFCGLRSSEIRGLKLDAINGDYLHVTQRADQWGKIGAPKTNKGVRKIPLGEATKAVITAYRPNGEYLFASGTGRPENHSNLNNRLWIPIQKRAGVEKPHGMHMMRHVAASLWIEQQVKDGIRNPKRVQEWLGHSTLQMTMDTYGHLWPDEDGNETASAAEQSILGLKKD